MQHLRAGHSVRTYFQSKILRAAACGFDEVHAKLTQVYAGIDVHLRQHLEEPTSTTTIDQYRDLLEQKESLSGLGIVRVSPTSRPESDRDFSDPVVFGHR